MIRVDLFMRMDTKQTEIAAAVHFASRHLLTDSPIGEMDVLTAVQEWKVRRNPPLETEEIAATVRGATVRGLNVLSWLDAHFSAELPINARIFS